MHLEHCKNQLFGIEEPNNVNRNGIDKQEIVVSPDIAERYVTPANRCDIILDGEIFSEPEIEYAGDKVSISTNSFLLDFCLISCKYVVCITKFTRIIITELELNNA